MSQLYIAQKLFSMRGRFAVTDAEQRPVYYVAGSFMQIPKTFTITDVSNTVVAQITKTALSWQPQFTVNAVGTPPVTIRKRFSFFKPRYDIEGPGLTVAGDWWNLDFAVLHEGREVARIRRRMLSWADTYEASTIDPSLDVLAVALVVAIDRVRADESSAVAAAT